MQAADDIIRSGTRVTHWSVLLDIQINALTLHSETTAQVSAKSGLGLLTWEGAVAATRSKSGK